VSFATVTLCVASQRVFIVVILYFVVDSVRILLDTPSQFVKGVFEGNVPTFATKSQVRVAGNALSNTSLECYHCSDLPGRTEFEIMSSKHRTNVGGGARISEICI